MFEIVRVLHSLSIFIAGPDQQSGSHCLIISAIQLLTPNNSGRTIRGVYVITPYKSTFTYLLTNLFTYYSHRKITQC